jgi:hypothetical protein
MPNALKILSTEVTISNSVPNTVSSASLVRIVNIDSGVSDTITLFYANGSVKATTTIGHYATDFARIDIAKQPDEKIQATNSSLKAVSIAYL